MYEVHSDHGTAVFELMEDVVSALYLLGGYHGIEISGEKVKKDLEENAYFEAFPLSVIRSAGSEENPTGERRGNYDRKGTYGHGRS